MEPIYTKRSHLVAFGRGNGNVDDKDNGTKSLLIDPPRYIEDEYFNVITMLAVFEHIEPAELPKILSEIYRVLKPGGSYIMTTPASWTDILLRVMAKLSLVSSVEIDDHKSTYTKQKIFFLLLESGFFKEKLKLGYFELFMNIWALAEKD